MKITAIHERTVPISRYADPDIPPGGLDTSAVCVVTDKIVDGEPVVGFGFSSIGRFGQGGLIRDRFAPRLLAAGGELTDPATGILDPFRAWRAMMIAEKPGGHGERSVAVGTLDMAVWDAAAKAQGLSLARFLQDHPGVATPGVGDGPVPVYAGGGYYFPDEDLDRLTAEMAGFAADGHTRAKIKVGAALLAEDMRRTEAAAETMGGTANLAVDAIYGYDRPALTKAARAFQDFGLWWFEDPCDPLDYPLMAEFTASYGPPVAGGEATFSMADLKNLLRYAGLRPETDILLCDIAHCYGLPEYLRMIGAAEAAGWDRRAFWPHGGHLFTLHCVAALGLGGAEINPHNFQPFGGLIDGQRIEGGLVSPPDLPGVGFEGRAVLIDLFRDILRNEG